MDFESSFDYEMPNKDKESVTEENYLDFLKKWLTNLSTEVENLRNHFNFKEILSEEVDLATDDTSQIITNIMIWIGYLMGCFQYSPEDSVFITNNMTDQIQEVLRISRQINIIMIYQLDDLQSASYSKYQQSFLKETSDLIFREILTINERWLEFHFEILKRPTPWKTIFDILENQFSSQDKIIFSFKNLNEISKSQSEFTPLNELLAELAFHQVMDLVKEAEIFFNEKRWDKVVFEMRKAFEIVVTSLVRKIQNDSNWNSPTKDGLNILRQKGIITDDSIHNQLKTKNIGVYGILSTKGVHPNGETTENLANSDLEASYCMALAGNAIEYLLKSFKKSEFFTTEE